MRNDQTLCGQTEADRLDRSRRKRKSFHFPSSVFSETRAFQKVAAKKRKISAATLRSQELNCGIPFENAGSIRRMKNCSVDFGISRAIVDFCRPASGRSGDSRIRDRSAALARP